MRGAMRTIAIAVFVLVGVATARAQESSTPLVDKALEACQAQVQKLANDVVTARLEALRKLDEFKAYDAAVKQREALKPPVQDTKKAPEKK